MSTFAQYLEYKCFQSSFCTLPLLKYAGCMNMCAWRDVLEYCQARKNNQITTIAEEKKGRQSGKFIRSQNFFDKFNVSKTKERKKDEMRV